MSGPRWLVSFLVCNTKVMDQCGSFLTNHQHTQTNKLLELDHHRQLFEFQWILNEVETWDLELH